MNKTRIGILGVAMVILLVVPAWSANELSVTSAAAVDGNFGLEITMDGSTNPTYVRDNTPNGETIYQARFWVDRLGSIFMDNDNGTKSTRFVGFRAVDANTLAPGGGTNVTVFRGIFGRLAEDNPPGVARYTWRMGCRQNNGNFRYIGGSVIAGDGKKWITMEFKASSGPGANDGICRLYQGNSKYVGNLQGERTDMNNDLLEVDQVWLGAVSGFDDNPGDPLTNGDLNYDSFESYRALLP